jgi:CheY-like chemotaxis protein
MLKCLGYKVIGKTSSASALKIFHAQPDIFDLIITDMTMRQMTGVELAKELLSIRPDIPIILCAGFSDVINKKVAKAQGIRELISKPINTRNIAETIRRVLKGST